MAINPINGKNNGVVHSKSANPTDKADKSVESHQATGKEAADKANILTITQDIKEALKSAASTPVIDQDKVAAVKEALLTGNYQINADSIASKMLQMERHFDST